MSQIQSVLTFDGIDDYIEVPYSEKLNRKIFTLSCWAKPTRAVQADNVVVSSYNYRLSQGYLLSLRSHVPDFYFFMEQHLYHSVPIANIWSHITATFDGSKLKLYFNGQAVGEVTVPSAKVNTSFPLRIGAGRDPQNANTVTHFFTGQIAELCIWNKVRTQQEIQSDMNKRLTGKEEGLVGYWPLNEGSGNTATDKTGNGKNGIIRGATWSQQEIPINPAEPTTGEFQVPINSLTGIEFTNKLAKDSSYKFTPSGTWKTPSDNQERTAAGLKGFPREIQPFYIEELRQYQQYLKYPNNTYLALLAVNKTTGVVTEVTEETTIVLRADETLTFLVNYFPTEYQHNTGTLTVKWSAT